MKATVEAELSAQQLADRLGVTPRMINIYRATAESAVRRKLGTKRGRTTFFNSEEQVLILKAQAQGLDTESVGRQHSQATAPDFSQANNNAEADITGGMDAIVANGDQNAIAIGQALGHRWNNLLWSSAIQTMQGGMVSMQQSFSELHTSVRIGLSSADLPQLAAGSSQPLLEEPDNLTHYQSDDFSS